MLVPLTPEEAQGILTDEHTTPHLESLDEAIARLTADGLPIARIASELHIGERTVDRHLEKLRVQFGLSTKSELAAFLARHGFGR